MKNIKCPNCGLSLNFEESLFNIKVSCPSCSGKFVVQSPAKVPAQTILPPAKLPPAIAPRKSNGFGYILAILVLIVSLSIVGFLSFSDGLEPQFVEKGRSSEVLGEEAVEDSFDNPQLMVSSDIDYENFCIIGHVNDLPVYDWGTHPSYPKDDWIELVINDRKEEAMKELRGEVDLALVGGDLEDRLKKAAEDSHVGLLMMRYELIRRAGIDSIVALAKRRQGDIFVQRLLSNPEWLQDFLVTGPARSREKTVQALNFWLSLFRYDKRSTMPLYRKLAIAFALQQDNRWQWSDGKKIFSILDSYQAYIKNHQEGRVHASFDVLESWEMLWVVNVDYGGNRNGDSRHSRHLAYENHSPRFDYVHAHSAIPWVRHNKFGDSVHHGPYHDMWRNDYVRGADSISKVWGVCGVLSGYASEVIRASGIPAFPVGQPGHCAFSFRTNKDWETHNSLSWQTWLTTFFGDGDLSMVRLVDEAYSNKDRKRLLRGHQHLWQKEYFKDNSFTEGPSRVSLYESKDKASSCNHISDLIPIRTMMTNDYQIVPHLTGKEKWRGALLERTIELEKDIMLNMSLASDDGSQLFINGECVIDNDGLHGVIEKSTMKFLPAGKHKIKIRYFDAGGGSTLDFSIKIRSDDPRVKLASELAIEEMPLHLPLWREIAFGDHRRIEEIGLRAVRSMGKYHRVCWEFLEKNIFPHLSSLPPERKLRFLFQVHQSLDMQTSNPTNRWHDRFLEKQVQFINQSSLSAKLFEFVLANYSHAGSDKVHILKWGVKNMLKDEKYTQTYLSVIKNHFSKSGDSKGASLKLGEYLVEAEKKENIEAFKGLSEISKRLMDGHDKYRIRHFDKKSAERFPKVNKYPGQLLSAEGVVSLSSHYDLPSVLTHQDAISDAPIGGLLLTKKEDMPFVKLKLRGEAELSGIVIVNRYEQLSDRNTPLRVSVSSDGISWKEIHVFKEIRPAWELDLKGKGIKAKYIRLDRSNVRSEYLNMRAFRVYGKKLY